VTVVVVVWRPPVVVVVVVVDVLVGITAEPAAAGAGF
jgi:hypothetical protein